MQKLTLKHKLIHAVKGTVFFDWIMGTYDQIWLMRRSNGSYSDHGEDRFVLEYFGGKKEGIYIDVGANHPFRVSNTYLLYRQGWHGITIEPITRLYDHQRRKRPRDTQLNCGVSSKHGSLTFFELTPGVMSTFEEKVARDRIDNGSAKLTREVAIEVVPLKEIIEEHLPGQQVDLLSVDTEGHDLDVLESIDWTAFRPQLVVCESFDKELPAIDACMESHGYKVLRRLGYNTVYEAQD